MFNGQSIEDTNKKTARILDDMFTILIKLGLIDGEVKYVFRGGIDCRKGNDPMGLQRLDRDIVEVHNLSGRALKKMYQIARTRAYKNERKSDKT